VCVCVCARNFAQVDKMLLGPCGHNITPSLTSDSLRTYVCRM
jgi:hypothetical protein